MQKFDVLVKCYGNTVSDKYIVSCTLRTRSPKRAEKCAKLLATRHGHNPTGETLATRTIRWA